jgi:deazaflavin-dependent oxidoreductase (nitroreductase family)
MSNGNVPFFVPLMNPLMKSLLRVGVPMGPMTLLTVRGRRSGRRHTTPVGLFEHDGRRYVFATFGEVNWVRNLRATGRATVGRGLRRRPVDAFELGKTDGARVLQAILAPYLASRVGRSFLRMGYDLKPDASPEAFAEEARQHPGFELREIAVARGMEARALSRPVDTQGSYEMGLSSDSRDLSGSYWESRADEYMEKIVAVENGDGRNESACGRRPLPEATSHSNNFPRSRASQSQRFAIPSGGG